MASGGSDITKTVCVGHLLVDVPVGADVRITGSYRAISVERVKDQKGFSGMKASVEDKANDLRNKPMKRDSGGDALDRKFGVDPEVSYAATRLIGIKHEESHQIAVGYHDKSSSDRFTAEIHRLIDDGHYVFATKNVGADKYPAVSDSVARAADRYVPLKNGEVPKQPGFCIGNGLFREDGVHDVGGDATLVVRLREHPSFTFTIDLSGLQRRPKESPLKDRIDGDLALLSQFSSDVKTLRRGKVEYAGQLGYEIDISAPSEDHPGTRMQKFFWGAEGILKNHNYPLIEAQLIIGDSGPSALTDDAAQALWLGLMSSLRVR